MKNIEELKQSDSSSAKSLSITTPFVMVIFGATGDLTQNKLMPSLFSLFKQGLFPKEFSIIGFARRVLSSDSFTNLFVKLKNEPGWSDFARHLVYQEGLFEEEKSYLSLIDGLKGFDQKIGDCALRLFYLATPPAKGIAQGCDQPGSK